MLVWKSPLLLALCALVAACDDNSNQGNSVFEKELQVASFKKTCTGLFNQLCLQVKSDLGSDWENHYNAIHNFQYQWGHEYSLRVQVTPIENPPADASSIEIKLLSIVQEKEDPIGTEYLLENLELDEQALSINPAGGYQLYDQLFTCSTDADCDALFSMNGSYGVVNMRFRYTGDSTAPIELVSWD